MANNFDSNISRKLMRSFIQGFEANRVISKAVDTQMFQGKFNPSTGETIDIKRPTDFKTKRTAGGDITAIGRSDITVGKASATVQPYFTVDVEWTAVEEALRMDQMDELLAPIAARMVTDFELDFAGFVMKNTSGAIGTTGVQVDTWEKVANGGAMMQSIGISGDVSYFMNPFTQAKLASVQRSLGAGPDSLIRTAHENATVSKNYAGMTVMAATTLQSFTTGAGADRAGTLSAAPTQAYASLKDTYYQTLAVTGFQANLQVKAGDTIRVSGRNMLNMATRQPIFDAAGAAIPFTATVANDVTLGASGEGNIVICGPAIFETGVSAAFNTVSSALNTGDVVTLLGSAATPYQPGLVLQKNAFSIASIAIPKLYSTDTTAKTKDGLQFRVSKYANGDANKQIVRFDFWPAYGVIDPYRAKQMWG